MPACLPTGNSTTHSAFRDLAGERYCRCPHRQKRPHCSAHVAAGGVRAACGIREMSTTPSDCASDPAMRWIVGGKAASWLCSLAEQMGRFGNAMAHGRKEFLRRLPISPANGRTRFMAAVRREASYSTWISSVSSDPRTRVERLERPLRMHLLSSAVRVQPVRRSGALRLTSRQRAQRRWMGGPAEAGRVPLSRQAVAHQFPRRRRLRQSLRSAEYLEAECIRGAHPSPRQPRLAGAHRLPAQAACRPPVA